MPPKAPKVGGVQDYFGVSLRWQYFKERFWLPNGLMKILLQNKYTRDYVNPAGGWTWEQERARVFSDGLQAIMFCWDRGILEMQLVCVFPDLAKNFTVAVTDRRQRL